VSHVNYGRNTIFDDTDTQTSSNSAVEFFSSRTVNTLEDNQGTATPIDDTFLFQSYSQSIEGFGDADQTPAGMTEAKFDAYLAGLGPMQWSESASQSIGGEFEGGPPMVTLGSASYSGTATVVLAPAPEPAAWGLMILGFGAMGVAVRHRRTALAA
ncbi:MAG TPA: PEPxxWA-CTERM sorting domain-containing protein, partial [Caulobacteraceae bacterium]|nr:PEPxxWA-CTERM sorting domain-containing protein [Caulobacteraceae bacterium]